MTHQAHPSLDDLADLNEGLLPPQRAGDLAAHVTACDACSAASAALDDVTRVLSAARSDPVSMPGPVTASLDEALQRAGAERASAVPSLTQYRATSRPATVPVRRPRWAWVAGAAAAIAFGYTGVNLLDSTPGGEDSAAGSATDSAEAEAERVTRPRGATRSPDGSSNGPLPADARELSAVTRKTLPGFAGGLATKTRSDDALSDCPSVGVSDDDRTAIVRWRGARARVVVDPSTRRVTVYRCSGDADPLFSTTY